MALFFIVVAHSGFIVLSFYLCFLAFIWKLIDYKQIRRPKLSLPLFFNASQYQQRRYSQYFLSVQGRLWRSILGSFPSPSVPSVNSPNTVTFVISHGKDPLFVFSASGLGSPLHSVLFSLSERGNTEKHRPYQQRCSVLVDQEDA